MNYPNNSGPFIVLELVAGVIFLLVVVTTVSLLNSRVATQLPPSLPIATANQDGVAISTDAALGALGKRVDALYAAQNGAVVSGFKQPGDNMIGVLDNHLQQLAPRFENLDKKIDFLLAQRQDDVAQKIKELNDRVKILLGGGSGFGLTEVDELNKKVDSLIHEQDAVISPVLQGLHDKINILLGGRELEPDNGGDIRPTQPAVAAISPTPPEVATVPAGQPAVAAVPAMQPATAEVSAVQPFDFASTVDGQPLVAEAVVGNINGAAYQQRVPDNAAVNRNNRKVDTVAEFLAPAAAESGLGILRSFQDVMAGHDVGATIDENNSRLRLPVFFDFKSGSATLNPEQVVGMARVADALAEVLPCYADSSNALFKQACLSGRGPIRVRAIHVKGFAGGGGVGTQRFNYNWRLANTRSLNALKTLIRNRPELLSFTNREGNSLFKAVGEQMQGSDKRSRRVELRLIMAK